MQVLTDIVSVNDETGLHDEHRDAIETFTGRFVRVVDLQPEDICIRDIAHSLSQESRHGGHALVKITVAQHCCWVHDVMEANRLPYGAQFAGLMHDAEEAYLRDIPRPIKRLPMFAEYRKLADKIRQTIWDKYGIDECWMDFVKSPDGFAVLAEIRDWKRSHGAYCGISHRDPIGPPIVPWRDCERAEEEFLKRFARYREID